MEIAVPIAVLIIIIALILFVFESWYKLSRDPIPEEPTPKLYVGDPVLSGGVKYYPVNINYYKYDAYTNTYLIIDVKTKELFRTSDEAQRYINAVDSS